MNMYQIVTINNERPLANNRVTGSRMKDQGCVNRDRVEGLEGNIGGFMGILSSLTKKLLQISMPIDAETLINKGYAQ